MRLLAGLGIRARLALALVFVAVLAVGLATVLSNRGLDPRLSAAAEARLQRSARQFALIAADNYRHHHGWAKDDTQSLERLAAVNGLHVTVTSANGETLALPHHTATELQGRPYAEASVRVNGSSVGSIRVTSTGSELLTPEEVGLRHSIDSLHLLAGAVSVAAALVVASLLAYTLARPLRRARMAAEAIARGELDTRVATGGGAELQALGLALNRLAETLQDEETLRKMSVADLAHELRTPVTGIPSRIEAAQDHVLADDAANLNAMHAEATRLTRLLDDLSRLGDAERPGMLVEKEPVELDRCVAQQVDIFVPQFAEQGIALHSNLDTCWVDGDADRLGQIASNLLSNALRYTPSGREVSVRVRVIAADAVIEVEDTGIGIRAEDVPHIFKRFWRAEKSRSRTTGGAGIGLAIVRELVDAHDGVIEVETRPDSGSTFRVLLPARRAPVRASGVPAVIP